MLGIRDTRIRNEFTRKYSKILCATVVYNSTNLYLKRTNGMNGCHCGSYRTENKLWIPLIVVPYTSGSGCHCRTVLRPLALSGCCDYDDESIALLLFMFEIWCVSWATGAPVVVVCIYFVSDKCTGCIQALCAERLLETENNGLDTLRFRSAQNVTSTHHFGCQNEKTHAVRLNAKTPKLTTATIERKSKFATIEASDLIIISHRAHFVA